MGQICVGSIQYEQVWKTRYSDAFKRCRTILPGFVQCHAAAPGNTNRRQKFRSTKPGTKNDDINRVMFTRLRLNASRIYFGNGVCNEIQVGSIDGRIPIVGNQNALTANLVIRNDLFPFPGIANVLARFFFGLQSQYFQQAAEPREGEASAFILPIDQVSVQPVPCRNSFEQVLLPGFKRPVRLWDYPGSRTLEERERFHLTGNLGHKLDRKSTRLNSSHVRISYA